MFLFTSSYSEDNCEGIDTAVEAKAVPGAKDACAVMQDLLLSLRQRQFCPDSDLCEAAPEQLCLGYPGSRGGMLQAEASCKI